MSKSPPRSPRSFAGGGGEAGKAPQQPEAEESGLRGSPAMLAAHELLDEVLDKPAAERRTAQVASIGVPQSVYLGYIHTELSNESACLELPLTICMLLCFSMFAIGILRQAEVFAVEEAMKFDIQENANFAWAHNFGHKTLHDANSIADVWSWLRLGFLPLVVQPSWAYSENYPAALGTDAYDGTNYSRPIGPSHWLLGGYTRAAPIKNDYLRYTRLVGGIKLHQTVAEPSIDACLLPTSFDTELLHAWLGKPCKPADDGQLTPEFRDSETFDEFTRQEWLLTELDSVEELTRALIDMEDGCSHAVAVGALETCRCKTCRSNIPRQPYIDEQTRRLEIAFITYNAQYGIYSYVGTNLFFNRGGHIHKHVNIMSAWADLFARPIVEFLPTVVAGSLWGIMLLKITLSELHELVSVMRSAHTSCWRALREDYLGFWNLVDWVSLTIGCVLVLAFFDYQTKVGAANLSLANMMDASNHAHGGTAQRMEYQSMTEAFFTCVETMVLSEKNLRLVLFFYPTILMLRLFKSFAAQPRLAIVTKTLERAAEDLIHFCIVFCCVYMCLVINSILFFGQDLQDFCTLLRAINSCFRAMFGDWDFPEMQEIGLIKAQIWFWSFMLLMVLILLNMLLAVIMDAYTEEKARARTAQSLVFQSFDMGRRFWQYRKGERVRLNDIWAVFEKEYHGDIKRMFKDDRLISIPWLLERVPHLREVQAKRTMEKSLARHEDEIEADITDETRLIEIQKAASMVEDRVHQMVEDIEQLAGRVQYYDRLQAHGDPEYDFHFGGEDRSSADASREAVSETVTNLSQEVCAMFVDNLKHIESWQDSFERQQNELHSLVAEMQIMVRQQAWCVAAMAEAVSQLSNEEGFASMVDRKSVV